MLRAQPSPAILELGNADMIESGLAPYTPAWPAFARTRAHDAQLGDWPLLRPAGPEPVGALSTNERRLAIAAGVAGAAFLAWRHLKKRRGRR